MLLRPKDKGKPLEKGDLSVERKYVILKNAEMYFGHMVWPLRHYCITTLSAIGLHG